MNEWLDVALEEIMIFQLGESERMILFKYSKSRRI